METLELYIPPEAEVKSIRLQSLPHSVLRQMSSYLSSISRKILLSLRGIWISPTVVGLKGQRETSNQKESMEDRVRSLLQTKTGPLQMSFISSCPAAMEVLKAVCPEGSPSQPHQPPQGNPTPYKQSAVLIHHGLVYVCVKGGSKKKQKSKRSFKEVLIDSCRDEHQSEPKRIRAATSVEERQNLTPSCTKEAKSHPVCTQSLEEELSLSALCLEEREMSSLFTKDEQTNAPSHIKKVQSPFVPSMEKRQSHHKRFEELHGASRGEAAAEKAAALPFHQKHNKVNISLHGDISTKKKTMSVGGLLASPTPSGLQASDFYFTELEHEEQIALMKARLRHREDILSKLQSLRGN